MNSSIIKLLAIVLAWPLSALALIVAYEWYQEATYVRVVEPLSHERIQHPVYFQFAQEALEKYGRLPKGDRQILKDQLRRAIVPIDVWLKRLNKSEKGIICLGESHDDHLRQFLATRFFPALDLDTLFLETTPEGLNQINSYIEAEETYVPLLNAHIGPVLNAVRARNPDVRIIGFEETPQQHQDRKSQGTGSREASIYANFKQHYDVNGGEGRTVVLYGALHCNYEPGVLYQLMQANTQVAQYQNILVQGAHQDGLMETFVYFLDELGIIPGDFVIADTQRLPIWVRENFEWLWAQTLTHYQSVVVYKP